MLQAEGTGRIARFGAFELDRQTGELRKHGIRIRLQGKPFQILVALLERPGETVAREDLRQRLWPGDTFVDFESGLNTAANRLRIALGDSADNPRYIETLARSGYRFIAPVEEVLPQPEFAEAPQPVDTKSDVPRPGPWWKHASLVAIVALAGIIFGAYAARKMWLSSAAADVKLQQITFRRGFVSSARFTPDGSVVYSAAWSEAPPQLYVANSLSPESRSLGFKGGTLAGVSRSGELALFLAEPDIIHEPRTLARVPMNGGSPLPVAKAVSATDWSPDGTQLAVVRSGPQDSIEYPIGTVLYKTWGEISNLRISPRGDMVAFLEHPYRSDDGGDVMVVDQHGKVDRLSSNWSCAGGLAWDPSGREVWFTASHMGTARELYGVNLHHSLRVIAKVPGTLTLHDISPTGKVLVARENANLVMSGWKAGEDKERDLSWFDWSNVVDISPDGDLVLFDESGEGAGPRYATYLHRLSTGETMRLGDGRAMALAPDGKSALTMPTDHRDQLRIVPVGIGQPRSIDGKGLEYGQVRFFPGGKQILFAGREPNQASRFYVQDLSGGPPKPVALDLQEYHFSVSPDGKSVLGMNRDNALVVQPLNGKPAVRIPAEVGLRPAGWSGDGQSVFAVRWVDHHAEVCLVNIATGSTEPVASMNPSDSISPRKVAHVVVAADGKSFVYSYHRAVSELYIVTGWR